MLQGLAITKGENLNITKDNPSLKTLKIGLGWDAKLATGSAYDLDVYAAGVDAGGKGVAATEFVYFGSDKNAAGRPSNANSSIVHSGDNLTGEGAGDDETIIIELDKVPANVQGIDIGVFIYDAVARGNQNFGQVKNAYARALDASNGDKEICRYDLSEDYSGNTDILVLKVYRAGADWKVKALGEGAKRQIAEIVTGYGLR